MLPIVVKNIEKSYVEGKKRSLALSNISFQVNQGEIFGLIGPDGAGKTTLFRILTTLLLADHGDAWVQGMDIRKEFRKIRTSIGYMPGKFSLYQDLSVEENLNFFATLFGTTVLKNYEFIKEIYQQIEPFKKRRAGDLSGGMKQKLALSCALVHKPTVLFLDEPTTGVDPLSRTEFWQILGRIKEQGISILVSTPYMDEAMQCERIALMQEGRILSIDTPGNMIQDYNNPLWSVTGENKYELIRDIRAFGDTRSCYAFGEFHHLSLKSSENVSKLEKYLDQKGHENYQIQVVQPTIEDCFLDLLTREEKDN